MVNFWFFGFFKTLTLFTTCETQHNRIECKIKSKVCSAGPAPDVGLASRRSTLGATLDISAWKL